jgi:hypothetical protein
MSRLAALKTMFSSYSPSENAIFDLSASLALQLEVLFPEF